MTNDNFQAEHWSFIFIKNKILYPHHFQQQFEWYHVFNILFFRQIICEFIINLTKKNIKLQIEFLNAIIKLFYEKKKKFYTLTQLIRPTRQAHGNNNLKHGEIEWDENDSYFYSPVHWSSPASSSSFDFFFHVQ